MFRPLQRVAFCLAIAFAMAGHVRGEGYPLYRPPAPQKAGGGLVAIPGAPLPAVPEQSVEFSIKLYSPFVAGLRRFLGDTPMTGRGIAYLATLHAAIGEYPKADELFSEAQRILEEKGGRRSEIAWIHNNRGHVQMETRRIAAAVRSFRAAVALLDPSQKNEQEPRVIVMENMAAAYSLIGDLESAEAAYLDALDTLRRLGKEGTNVDHVTRGNLATLYSSMGDYEAARVILEKLAAQKKLSFASRYQTLVTLGYVLSGLGRFSEAEARLLELKPHTANGTKERALVLMNLAATYGWAEDFDRAATVGEEALVLAQRLWGDDSRVAAALKANLAASVFSSGELLKADRLLTECRNVLGGDPGDEEAYLFATRTQALVAQRRGQRERAMRLSREGLELSTRHLERILAFGSESQKLAWLTNAAPFDQLAHFGDADLLAEAALTIKGAVLESLLAERALTRRSRSAADQERVDSIRALRVEIMEKIGRGENIEPLARALKQEETALAKTFAVRLRLSGAGVDAGRIRKTLHAGQVLVEIMQYQRYGDRGKRVPAYGGIVIRPGQATVWVPIGDADSIDRAIAGLQARFRGPGRSVGPRGRGGDVVPALRELHDRVWKPLTTAFPAGTRDVLLSPDGATCFLPWPALLNAEESFVAEKWRVTQLGSGRDLVRTASPGTAKTLFALADGGGDLLHSRQEVKDIVELSKPYAWRTTVLVGDDALEGTLIRHPRPRILHLATHGGQLDREAGETIANRLSRNPMYRGYVLLSGGYETLEAWKQGTAAPFATDGILTAEEASGLDLDATLLTVLSACDTGAGDISAGEGVLGLRRAFALAGSENLLFSLWRVRDEATAEYMTAFYKRLFAGGDPVAAFHETQLVELRRWKDASGIADAVYHAGGFALTRHVAAPELRPANGALLTPPPSAHGASVR